MSSLMTETRVIFEGGYTPWRERMHPVDVCLYSLPRSGQVWPYLWAHNQSTRLSSYHQRSISFSSSHCLLTFSSRSNRFDYLWVYENIGNTLVGMCLASNVSNWVRCSIKTRSVISIEMTLVYLFLSLSLFLSPMSIWFPPRALCSAHPIFLRTYINTVHIVHQILVFSQLFNVFYLLIVFLQVFLVIFNFHLPWRRT